MKSQKSAGIAAAAQHATEIKGATARLKLGVLAGEVARASHGDISGPGGNGCGGTRFGTAVNGAGPSPAHDLGAMARAGKSTLIPQATIAIARVGAIFTK